MPDAALSRYTVMASWSDCPHLDEQAKAEMLAEYPPYQRDARSRGIPALGSGTVYQVPEGEYRIGAFEIPDHWPRCWGMDTDAGAGWTACVWLAWDREANVYYVYDMFKRSHVEPAVTIAAVKARGAWIPGVADAAGLAVTVHDSTKVIEILRDGGLDVVLPEKALEAGLQACWELLSGGRLKVFANCGPLFDEMRLYRRDEKGRIVKKDDHCLHPSTRVWTDRGLIPILDLVDTMGYAIGHDGAMVRFGSVRRTRTDAEMVTVSFDDGRNVVTCTPDHRFWTTDGWVRAEHMQGRTCLDAVEQRGVWVTCLSDQVKRFRSIVGRGITSVVGTTNARECVSTGRSGKISTDPFRKGTPSITLMAVEQTTRRRTSRLWSEVPTPRIIPWAFLGFSPRTPYAPRQSGTPAKRGWRGTDSTMPRWDTRCTSARSGTVITADAFTLPSRARETFASARTPARPHGVTRLAWTTKNVLARFAARLFWRIATRRNATALALARRRCVSVYRADKSDAYCLEVYGTHGLAVEGGVVVSNCVDAMRYAVVSGRGRMKTKPGPSASGSALPLDPKLANVNWMR